jgi:hypothetical protein
MLVRTFVANCRLREPGIEAASDFRSLVISKFSPQLKFSRVRNAEKENDPVKAILFASLLIGSVASHAATKCDADVVRLAQINLDQYASKGAYEATVSETPEFLKAITVNVAKSIDEKRLVYSVGGYVYKGTFDIVVTVAEDDCSVRNVTVNPKFD